MPVDGSLGISVDATGSLGRPRQRGMGPRLAVAIALTFLALLLLVTATWVAAARIIADSEEVTRTRRVIISLDDTIFSLKDSETNLKAFLLTNRLEDLKPFREGVAELVRRLSRIASLAADDKSLADRAPALRKLADESGSELKAAAEILAAGHRDEALRGVSEVRAHRAMDEIRRLVGEMSSEERARLGSREEETRASIRNLVGTLTVGATLQFGLLFAIWYLIRGDLARRDRSERAIRDREARIRRLVNSNLVGVLFSDPDGITEANDAFLSIVGLDRRDWNPRAQKPFGFTAPEFRRLDDECEVQLRKTGTCRPYQKELVRKDGSRVPVLFGAAVVEPAADRAVWAWFTIVDLSELKRLEAERNRLYQEARDAVEARDAFLSVAGHEIRTPVSALNLLVYQLSRRLKTLSDEKAIELVGKCRTPDVPARPADRGPA